MYVGLIGDLLFFIKVLIDWYFSQEGQKDEMAEKDKKGRCIKVRL